MPLVRLRHKPGGGLVPDAGGYACVKCHSVTDAAEALHAYTLQLKQEAIKHLQQEMEQGYAAIGREVPGDKDS